MKKSIKVKVTLLYFATNPIMTYFRMVFLMRRVVAVIISNAYVLDVNTMEFIMMLEKLGSKENVKSNFIS